MIKTYLIALALLLSNPLGYIAGQDKPAPNNPPEVQKQDPKEKKIAEYRQQLTGNPNDIELHRAYQNFMRQCGNLTELKEEYLLKLAVEPENPLYLYLYGRLAENTEVEISFKKALELEAKTPNPELRFWLYFGFGQFYLDTKKYKEALRYLDMAIKLKPDSLDARHQKALVYYETDNISEALNLWDKILTAKKDYPEAFLGKALIYKSRNMTDKAIEELENILKIDATFWRAYEPLIQCYHAKKDYKRGEELRIKLKDLYLKRFDRGINFGYLELITIDIISLKPGIIIAKERITPYPEPDSSRFAYADYYFEIYQKSINKDPPYIYEIYGDTKQPEKGSQEIFSLIKVTGGISTSQTKRETIKEYAAMPGYSDLLNDVLEREQKK